MGGEELKALTLVLPFYRNRGMLAEHQRVWADYAPDLRKRLHVVVVDDCSPVDDALRCRDLTLDGLASFRAYQIMQKVRWNWLACRNLGMHVATTDWVLLTDIDHVMPAETFTALLDTQLDKRNVYRLSRIDAPHPWPYRLQECGIRETKRTHPNTWLMTRQMYDVIGGYDERLSGCYGTDGEFKDRVQASAKAVVLLSDVMIRYGREILADASTSPAEFTRKGDPENDDELRRRRAIRADVPGWKPLRLTFPWAQLVGEGVPC